MAYDPQTLNPELLGRINALIAEAMRRYGIELVPVQGTRTNEEQAALYAQGRTAPGSIVTNAPPGASRHNHGTAVDLVPRQLIDTPNWSPDSPIWAQVGALADEFGLEWGGNWTSFVDRPHFQLPGESAGAHQGHSEPSGAATAAPPGMAAPQMPAPAPQAPPPAPTPVVDALQSIGNALQPAQNAAPATVRPNAPFSADMLMGQKRDELADFLMPTAEEVSTAPEPLQLAPKENPGGFLTGQRPAGEGFRPVFGPARNAPLRGGTKIRA